MATKPTTAEVTASIKSTGKRKGVLALVVAIALTASGYEGTRLDVYDDGLGIPTTCMGQTQGVKFGQADRTLDQCTETLLVRVQANQDALQQRVGPIKTPAGPITYLQLTAGEQEAYNSFFDNVGPGKKDVKDGFFAIKKTGLPSRMVTLLRAGQRREACEQFMEWLNPKWMRGIKVRRQSERAHCLRDLPAAA